jgi:ankyrin repeat protein
VDQSSPKGCTPLIYAGRGGYSLCVEYLLQKKASALKQDNAGGTVLHHAIEKGHIQVLETMLGLGVDVYSAIEIADNAGRTPLFEAVENMEDDGRPTLEIIDILTKKKKESGFGANPNIINYSG